jgi:hypothetical protein
MPRSVALASLVATLVTALVGLAAPAPCQAQAPEGSASYVQVMAGPAYVTYFPIDDSGLAEHLALGAGASAFSVGRGFDLGGWRLDTGLRAQHLHVGIEGSYSLTEDGDDYRANYDYLALLAEIRVASEMDARVNVWGAATIGTARHFSDRKGEPLHNHQLPVYGTFEAGILVRLDAAIEATAGVSWVPPVAKVSVLSPMVGARIRL